MAQKVLVELIDDLDGSTAEETVTFGLDGSEMEIDLSANNAGVLRDILGDYVRAGRKVTKQVKGVAGRKTSLAGIRSAATVRADREQMAAAREWARLNGWPNVKDRGRLPADALAAYQAQAGRSRSMQPA